MCELQPDLCGGLVVQTLAIVMCGSGDACKPLNGSTMCVYVTFYHLLLTKRTMLTMLACHNPDTICMKWIQLASS